MNSNNLKCKIKNHNDYLETMRRKKNPDQKRDIPISTLLNKIESAAYKKLMQESNITNRNEFMRLLLTKGEVISRPPKQQLIITAEFQKEIISIKASLIKLADFIRTKDPRVFGNITDITHKITVLLNKL